MIYSYRPFFYLLLLLFPVAVIAKAGVAPRAIWGNPKGKVQLVVFSDFQCHFCAKGAAVVEELEKRYPGEVAVFLRHFPIESHPMAVPAAKRYEAIALQSADLAHRFHAEVFRYQRELNSKREMFLDSAAKEVGADIKRMYADMESPIVIERIQDDIAAANKLGVQGTPFFMVNDVQLSGARPVEEFVRAIEKKR